MSRYDNSSKIKNKFGKTILSTNIIRTDLSTDDIYIQITSPQRIDLLAYDFYGDVENWYVIAAANGLGRGSLWIPSDTVIRIPSINNVNSYIQQINLDR